MDPEVFPRSEIVRTDTAMELHEHCDECRQPLIGRRRKIRRRRFCSPTCRARWHRQRRATLQAEASRLLERCAAIIEELAGKG
jgi:hypothetical protein